MLQELLKLREDAKKLGEPILRDKSFELLMKTVKEKQPKSILEIGVNLGLSSIAMLLSSSNAKLSGIEIDEEKVFLSRSNYKKFGVDDRANIFYGDASEVLPIITAKYDFVFLDGPKGHYYEYLPHILNLLNEGGTLFADNVLFRGLVEAEKPPHRDMTIVRNLRAFIDELTQDKNYTTSVIDAGDGVLIAYYN